jgi:transposase-like protein
MGRYQGRLDLASIAEVLEGHLGDGVELGELVSEGLDAIARQGARILLQTAMEQEVAEFLGRRRYERGGRQAGYRNGSRRRGLTCGSGSFDVDMPKVTGADERFSLRSIPAYARSSERMLKTLPLLYAEGLSTRDFERALRPFWKRAGLSRSSISRANAELHRQFGAWRRRDISGTNVLYLFLDAVNERVRFRSSEKEGVLVAHAILEDGSRELLAIHLGPRETGASWRAVLEDLVRRGMSPPKLVVSDGCPGLIAAVEGLWPGVPRQRCTAHKTRNVIGRVPRKDQARVKRDISRIFHAASLDEAERAVGEFLSKYGDEFPTACETLCRDLEDCLTFYRFPEAHWKRIRTSNVIERAFKEVRRRTRVVGRFPTEKSALMLIWASIEQDRLNWRGVKMTPAILQGAVQAVEGLKASPIRVDSARKYLAAA